MDMASLGEAKYSSSCPSSNGEATWRQRKSEGAQEEEEEWKQLIIVWVV